MEDTARPKDEFTLQLANWSDYPQATKVGPAIVQTQTFLGNAETWTVQTIRHSDLGEAVFIQRIHSSGSMQLALPPKVTEAIARQRDSISAKNRRRGARRAVETKRELGLPVGNPEALRKARKSRKRR